jgi:hypothetical protein
MLRQLIKLRPPLSAYQKIKTPFSTSFYQTSLRTFNKPIKDVKPSTVSGLKKRHKGVEEPIRPAMGSTQIS